MKKLLIFLFLFGFGTCEEDSFKIFNSESPDDLDLANIDNFWKAGLDIDTTYYMGATFENETGFIVLDCK